MAAVRLLETLDERIEVGLALHDAAGHVLTGTEVGRLNAIEWLVGRHPGWLDLYGELPSELRDRMRRTAGDLAIPVPDADFDAARLLTQADDYLTGEMAA